MFDIAEAKEPGGDNMQYKALPVFDMDPLGQGEQVPVTVLISK